MSTLKYDIADSSDLLKRKEARYLAILTYASWVSFSKKRWITANDIVEIAKKKQTDLMLSENEINDALELYCVFGGAAKGENSEGKIEFMLNKPSNYGRYD